jgi:hypothetical protein
LNSRLVILALLIGLLIVGSVAVYQGALMASPRGSSTFTSSATTTYTVTSTVGIGVDLLLTLNTTQLVSGHTINATAEIFNELHIANNVTVASIWPLPALEHPSRSGGCPFYVTVEFFQGYYTRLNVSSSAQAQVQFWNGPAPSCVEYTQNLFSFQPQSDKVVIGTGSTATLEPLLYSVSVDGYYQSNNSNSSVSFAPGIYTVVAADEWGQIAVQYLNVSE